MCGIRRSQITRSKPTSPQIPAVGRRARDKPGPREMRSSQDCTIAGSSSTTRISSGFRSQVSRSEATTAACAAAANLMVMSPDTGSYGHHRTPCPATIRAHSESRRSPSHSAFVVQNGSRAGARAEQEYRDPNQQATARQDMMNAVESSV